MSYNAPEDCGLNSPYKLPWDTDEIYCEYCGSNMYISSFDKDSLGCSNEDCGYTLDLSNNGMMDDW